MAEPARSSALAGMSTVPVAGPEPVAITALHFRGKLVLRGGSAISGAAQQVLGTGLPPMLRSARGEQAVILGLGPDEWLILCDSGAEAALARELRTALEGSHHALVVISDRLTGIAITGGRAREVLAAGCALDLHPSVFATGAVTRTLLGKATVVLWRPDAGDRFELLVNGSFAPYLWQFLRNAALEFGVISDA